MFDSNDKLWLRLSLLESALPIDVLERDSFETERALPVDCLRRSSQYMTYKKQEVVSFSLGNSVPLPLVTTFYNENIISTESILNRKILCSSAHPHGVATE